MKSKMKYGITGIATLMTMSLSCIKDKYEEGLEVGDALPEFTIKISDGSVANVPEDLQGSISCIVFFNTECPDCQEELPVVQKFYDARPDIKVLLVSRDEEEKSITKYWADNSLTMPFSAQTDRKIYNLFAKSSIPRIYLSDSNCRIKFIFTDATLPSLSMLLDASEKLK